MMLHITADVIFRYVFNSPMPGTITIVSHYYMAIAAFIPLAFTEQKNSHISVDVLTARMPAFLRRYLDRFAVLVSILIFGVITVRSFVEANKKYQQGASVVQGDSEILIGITYYLLPVGAGLMVLMLIYKLVLSFSNSGNGLDTELAKADELSDH
tara:strand:+ start:686 stop:1150 length:465 start_codon:yes stop_codon:yes gene_type:complete